MSKSTGQFLTLDEAVKKFGADATRVMLSDAGDASMIDSNADETVANAAILQLYTLKAFIEDVVKEPRILQSNETFAKVRESLRAQKFDSILRSGTKGFWDELFENELHTLALEAIEQYKATQYKIALKVAFYDLAGARDFYRIVTHAGEFGMHQDSLRKFVEYQALLLAPITPHWSDYIWQEVLGHKSTICLERFPQVPTINSKTTAISQYVRSVNSTIGAMEGQAAKKAAKKGKTAAYDTKADKRLRIYVAKSFPKWQDHYLEVVRKQFDATSLKVDTNEINKQVAPADKKKAMPFISAIKRRIDAGEKAEVVFNRKLEFDETQILKELIPTLKTIVTKLKQVELVIVDETTSTKGVNAFTGERVTGISLFNAEPGSPAFEFSNIA
jgi:leucyl-tRNA synthetase